MAGSIRHSLCLGSLAAVVALLLCAGGFLGLLCGVSVIHCSPVKAARSMPDQITIPMPAPGRKGIVVSRLDKRLCITPFEIESWGLKTAHSNNKGLVL